jgi:hypothetical protein
MLEINWNTTFQVAGYEADPVAYWKSTFFASGSASVFKNADDPMAAMVTAWGVPTPMQQQLNYLGLTAQANGDYTISVGTADVQRMGFKNIGTFYTALWLSMPASRSAMTLDADQNVVVISSNLFAETTEMANESQQTDSYSPIVNMDIIQSNIAYASRVLAPEADAVGSYIQGDQDVSFARLAVASDIDKVIRKTAAA